MHPRYLEYIAYLEKREIGTVPAEKENVSVRTVAHLSYFVGNRNRVLPTLEGFTMDAYGVS